MLLSIFSKKLLKLWAAVDARVFNTLLGHIATNHAEQGSLVEIFLSPIESSKHTTLPNTRGNEEALLIS